MDKKFFSLTAIAILALSACVDNRAITQKLTKEYLEMSAFTNNSMNDPYDSKFFYRNDLKNFGGDAGVIYVSEEQDPVYGGYYYLYHSGNDNMYAQDYGTYYATIPVVRSKDLNDWELVGAVNNGFAAYIDKETDWCTTATWAPEVIYDPVSEKYFMYYNASSKINPHYIDGSTSAEYATYHYEGNTGNNYDRFYLCILVSDTPVGPFRVATSANYYGDPNQANPNGEIVTTLNPQINIKYHFNSGELFGVIDASPFFDENGDLYLYFARHVCTGNSIVSIWGMKMKDMITPDYDTLTMLLYPNCKQVTKKANWADQRWSYEAYHCEDDFNAPFDTGKITAEGYKWEGGGNEAPYVYKVANNRYLLMYSARGYNDVFYDTSQSYGTHPLGPFTKPPLRPSAVIGANDNNDFMTGTGHSAFVKSPSGDELFCYYWVQGDPLDTSNTPWRGEVQQGAGRVGAFDRLFLVDTEYGKLMYGNGPTKSCQPKLADVSGYRNVAPKGTFTLTNLVSGKDYINDGMFVSHEYYKNWETQVSNDTIITIAFDEPQTVGAVMVYNSYDYNYAFKKLDYIEFGLAEPPSWYQGDALVNRARVSNIEFSSDFITGQNSMRPGGSCFASFDDITVNFIKIKVSGKYSTARTDIKISDIWVLGK
ncbi:MAG: family 43 glycosylhydrolase [Syntrophomonadaceae bacterium]|jgi:hypothetical protein